MSKMLMFIFIPFFIFSSDLINNKSKIDIDKGIDSMIVVDPYSPLKQTKIDFNSFFMLPSGFSYFMISPRMNVCFNGDFGTSFGLGFRRPFSDMIIGHHIFYDYMMQRPHSFHQLGTSLEFLSNDYDFRINYYNPISKSKCDLKLEKWVEAESVWKFTDFCVGISPIYSFTAGKWSVKPKIILPFQYFLLETGIYVSQSKEENSAYFSIGIPLYNLGQHPVSRCSNVKFSHSKLSSSSAKVKKKNQKKDQIQESGQLSNEDQSQSRSQEPEDIM